MPLLFDNVNTLERARIETSAFQAEILLQGAALMHFAPRGQKGWIFQSDATPFAPTHEIYGGVPVVFPWFGRLAGNRDALNHGWARQAIWTLQDVDESHDSATVSLGLASEHVRDEGFDVAPWPHDFFATMTFRFGNSLGMRLEIQNRDASSIRFECALHTYFAVSDVSDVRVEGFAGERWKGNPGHSELHVQNGDITFGEKLTQFFARGDSARIRDGNRTLLITENEGWRSTIVWNPGDSMPEQNAEDWRRFVCVEAGAIDEHAVTLAPGDTYALDIEIALA